MGLEKVHSFKSERENVDEDVMKMGRGILGNIEVDLMTPINPDKSPKVHIPSLNHIGLWVDDLPKCVEYLECKLVLFLYLWQPRNSECSVESAKALQALT